MWIVGLLSSKQEADELKDIARICVLEDRIHFIVRMQKLRDLINKE